MERGFAIPAGRRRYFSGGDIWSEGFRKGRERGCHQGGRATSSQAAKGPRKGRHQGGQASSSQAAKGPRKGPPSKEGELPARKPRKGRERARQARRASFQLASRERAAKGAAKRAAKGAANVWTEGFSPRPIPKGMLESRRPIVASGVRGAVSRWDTILLLNPFRRMNPGG